MGCNCKTKCMDCLTSCSCIETEEKPVDYLMMPEKGRGLVPTVIKDIKQIVYSKERVDFVRTDGTLSYSVDRSRVAEIKLRKDK